MNCSTNSRLAASLALVVALLVSPVLGQFAPPAYDQSKTSIYAMKNWHPQFNPDLDMKQTGWWYNPKDYACWKRPDFWKAQYEFTFLTNVQGVTETFVCPGPYFAKEGFVLKDVNGSLEAFVEDNQQQIAAKCTRFYDGVKGLDEGLNWGLLSPKCAKPGNTGSYACNVKCYDAGFDCTNFVVQSVYDGFGNVYAEPGGGFLGASWTGPPYSYVRIGQYNALPKGETSAKKLPRFLQLLGCFEKIGVFDRDGRFVTNEGFRFKYLKDREEAMPFPGDVLVYGDGLHAAMLRINSSPTGHRTYAHVYDRGDAAQIPEFPHTKNAAREPFDKLLRLPVDVYQFPKIPCWKCVWTPAEDSFTFQFKMEPCAPCRNEVVTPARSDTPPAQVSYFGDEWFEDHCKSETGPCGPLRRCIKVYPGDVGACITEPPKCPDDNRAVGSLTSVTAQATFTQVRGLRVAVLDVGLSYGLGALLSSLRVPYEMVLPNDLNALADYNILIVPSGAMEYVAQAPSISGALAAFVERGGNLIVFSQPYGWCFSALPGKIGGYGYLEDLLCDQASVYLDHPQTLEPALCRMSTTVLDVSVDGTITQWPDKANVLLRRTSSGLPAMVTYPYGAGRVTVTTLFPDGSKATGWSSQDERTLVQDLVLSHLKPNMNVYTRGQTPEVTTQVVNVSPYPSSFQEMQLYAPSGQPVEMRSDLAVPSSSPGFFELALAPDQISQSLKLNTASLPLPEAGIYTWRYDLGRIAPVEFTGEGRVDIVDGPVVGPSVPLPDATFAISQQSRQPYTAREVLLSIYQQQPVNLGAGQVIAPLEIRLVNAATRARRFHLYYQGNHSHLQEEFLGEFALAPGQTQIVRRVKPASQYGGYANLYGDTHAVYAFAEDAPPRPMHPVEPADPWGPVGVTYVTTQAPFRDSLFTISGLKNVYARGERVQGKFTFTNPWGTTLAGRVRLRASGTDYTGSPPRASVLFEIVQPFAIPATSTADVFAETVVPATAKVGQGFFWGLEYDLGDGQWRSYPCSWFNWQCLGWFSIAASKPTLALEHLEFTGTAGTPKLDVFAKIDNTSREVATGAGELRVVLRDLQGTKLAESVVPGAIVAGGSDVLRARFDALPALGESFVIALSWSDTTWAGEVAAASSRTVTHRSWVTAGGQFYAGYGAPAFQLNLSARPTGASGEFADFVENGTVRLQVADLGFDQSVPLASAWRNAVAVPVQVPIPVAAQYGEHTATVTWTGVIGSTSTWQGTLVYFRPWVTLTPELNPASARAGDTITVHSVTSAFGFSGQLPVTVALSIPDFAVSESRTASLAENLPFTFDRAVAIPADARSGEHLVTLKFTGPLGQVEEVSTKLFVPPPQLAIAVGAQDVAPGAQVSARVSNVGGAATTGDVSLALLQGDIVPYATAKASAPLAPGAAQDVTLTVPDGLAAGKYGLWVAVNDLTSGTWTYANAPVTVRGVTAQLHVSTDRPIYAVGDGVLPHAALTNGGLPLRGNLPLEIVRARTTKVKPWGTSQGDASRTGVCDGGGALVGRDRWYVVKAQIPALGPSAAVDLDGDGAADLVTVRRDARTGITELIALHGPALDVPAVGSGVPLADLGWAGDYQVAALPLRGESAIDIVLVYENRAGQTIVSCRNWLLAERWRRALPRLPGTGFDQWRWPSSVPLAVDWNQDGILDVAAATSDGNAVILSGSDGTTLFDLSQSFATAVGAGLRATGVSAGDVNADGLPELVVTAAVEQPPNYTGAVIALATSGKLLWRYDTMSPVVAPATIADLDGDGLPEVVAVDVGHVGGVGCTAFCLSGSNGTLRWDSSPLAVNLTGVGAPAVGDVDGDGKPEVVIAGVKRNRSCLSLGSGEIAALRGDGALLWSRAIPVCLTAPALVDLNGDGVLDVASGGVFLSGRTGVDLQPKLNVCTVSSSPPEEMRVADLAGDGVPRLIAGAAVLEPVCLLPPAVAPESVAAAVREFVSLGRHEAPVANASQLAGCSLGGTTSGQEVMWTTNHTLDVVAGASPTFDDGPVRIGMAGAYVLKGRVQNSFGQEIARDAAMFSVVPAAVAAELQVPVAPVPLGSGVDVTTRATNRGVVGAQTTLSLVQDGVQVWQITMSLSPGQTFTRTDTLAGLAEGAHKFDLVVSIQGGQGYTLTRTVQVVAPVVKAFVDAPKFANFGPMRVALDLWNTSPFVEKLDVQLTTNHANDAPQTQHLQLAPGDETLALFTYDFGGPTTFTFTVGGDVRDSLTATVQAGAQLHAVLGVSGVLPAGDTQIVLQATNTGVLAYQGAIAWTLSGASVGSGAVQVAINPGSSTHLFIHCRLEPGQSVLALSGKGLSAQIPVTAARSALGQISLAVPQPAVEGVVPISYQLANPASTPATMAVSLAVEQGGIPLASEGFATTLAGAATTTTTFAVSLKAGSYEVVGTIGGVIVARRPLQVVPREAATLSVTASGAILGKGIPVAVKIVNTGATNLAGRLLLAPAGGVSQAVDAALAVGRESSFDFFVNPDDLIAGNNVWHASLVAADGITLADQQVQVAVSAAQTTIAALPAPTPVVAGQAGEFGFTLANTGDRTDQVYLWCAFMGAEVLQEGHEVRVPGHGSVVVSFPFVVPADAPQRTFPLHYRLMRQDPAGGPAVVLQEGEIDISVLGVQFNVAAQLDKRGYVDGEIAHLRLTVTSRASSAPALVAKVMFDGASQQRSFALGPSVNIDFDVPLHFPAPKLAYGVFTPAGRALLLDSAYVRKTGGDVMILPDKDTYSAGSTAAISVRFSVPGQLEVELAGVKSTVAQPGTVSLIIPAAATQGSYPIRYRYLPGVGSAQEGEVWVDVLGLAFSVGQLQLDRNMYNAGDTLHGRLMVRCNRSFQGAMAPSLLDSLGRHQVFPAMPVNLQAGVSQVLTLDVPIQVSALGAQRLFVELQDSAGQRVAGVSAVFDCGAASLAGVATDRPEYPNGDETVQVWVTLLGQGTGQVTLSLDGVARGQQTATFSGARTITIPITSVAPGAHKLVARLTVGGQAQEKSTQFLYGTLMPDLEVLAGSVKQEELGEGELRATIINHGLKPSAPTVLEVRTPSGLLLATAPVPAIPGEGEVVVNADWEHASFTEGWLTVTVNPDRRAVEYRYDNNSTEVYLAAPQPPPREWDAGDIAAILNEMFDSDGTDAKQAGGGWFVCTGTCDVNGDGLINAADLKEAIRQAFAPRIASGD